MQLRAPAPARSSPQTASATCPEALRTTTGGLQTPFRPAARPEARGVVSGRLADPRACAVREATTLPGHATAGRPDGLAVTLLVLRGQAARLQAAPGRPRPPALKRRGGFGPSSHIVTHPDVTSGVTYSRMTHSLTGGHRHPSPLRLRSRRSRGRRLRVRLPSTGRRHPPPSHPVGLRAPTRRPTSHP